MAVFAALCLQPRKEGVWSDQTQARQLLNLAPGAEQFVISGDEVVGLACGGLRDDVQVLVSQASRRVLALQRIQLHLPRLPGWRQNMGRHHVTRGNRSRPRPGFLPRR